MSEYFDAKFCRAAYEEYRDFAERVWAGYKFYARGSSVIRKGFENTGVAIHADDSLDYAATFYRRSESDLEHQAKTAWLALVFMANLPWYFGGERYYTVPIDIWLRYNISLTHDSGEVEIGDIMDDGNPDHKTKDKAELEAFQKILIAYPEIYRQEAIGLFKAFQKKNTREGMAIAALDKLDAIFTNLYLEKCGLRGSIYDKPHPTELDIYYAEKYGSDAPADVWCAHMLDRTTKDFPPDIMEPIIAVVIAASIDVRGKELACVRMS